VVIKPIVSIVPPPNPDRLANVVVRISYTIVYVTGIIRTSGDNLKTFLAFNPTLDILSKEFSKLTVLGISRFDPPRGIHEISFRVNKAKEYFPPIVIETEAAKEPDSEEYVIYGKLAELLIDVIRIVEVPITGTYVKTNGWLVKIVLTVMGPGRLNESFGSGITVIYMKLMIMINKLKSVRCSEAD
jgi:hypothetical protein